MGTVPAGPFPGIVEMGTVPAGPSPLGHFQGGLRSRAKCEMGTVPRAKGGLRSCAAAEERGPPVRHMPMMDWGRQFPRGSLTDHLS